jgi:hypothetical protein
VSVLWPGSDEVIVTKHCPVALVVQVPERPSAAKLPLATSVILPTPVSVIATEAPERAWKPSPRSSSRVTVKT